MILEGNGSTLQVFEERLEISSPRWYNRKHSIIFFKDITNVLFAAPGWLTSGKMGFATSGNPISNWNNSVEIVKEENVVFFNKSDLELAEKIRDFVINKIQNIGKEKVDPTMLLKYKQLLDAGVITQEDFDAKKKEILG